MTSILLIMTPALLLFAVLIGMKLAGKKPTRRTVNTSSSLLLFLYFMMTAGLGIFWVARQHLPVFDLHYLFGYITVLLVCFHAYLNRSQIKLRFKPQTARPNTRPPLQTIGRSLFLSKLPAAILTGAICFWIGAHMNKNCFSIQSEQISQEAESDTLQTPREVPNTPPPVQRQMIRNGENKTPLAIYYHDATKNTRWNMSGTGLDWSSQPDVFKSYPAETSRNLPPPHGEQPDKTGEAIDRIRRAVSAFEPGQMTADDLSSILMLNNGVTGTLDYPGVKYFLRSAPSAGALYPAITYVFASSVNGMEPGLYHYDVKEHKLDLIDSGPELKDKLLAAVPTPALLENADAVFIYTANYFRSSWKYGKRAYRYILMDTGHVAKNALLGAEAFGYQGNLIGCFDDQLINTLLQIDPNEEGALLLLPLGKGKKAPPVAYRCAVQSAPQPLAGKADPLVLLSHGQTCLKLDHSRRTICPTADNRIFDKSYPDLPVFDLPDSFDAGDRLIPTLLNRRSVRTWADAAMTQAQLSSLLYYSFGIKNENGEYLSDPGVAGASFLNLYLVINNVDGLDTGVYYYNRQRHNLSQIRKGNFRRTVYEAALSQGVVGDSCVCFIITTSNKRLNHPDGDRSLRYAGLEAGLIGENIYLQTQALGLGCTGIGAYFDDEVSELIDVPPEEEAITYLLAAGVKQKNSN